MTVVYYFRFRWGLGLRALVCSVVLLQGCIVGSTVPCQSSSECVAQFGPTAYCEPSKGLCAEIQDGGSADLSSPDGGDSGPSCTPSQCPDDMPICSGNVCAACSGPNDDAACAVHKSSTPRCGLTGTCVECRPSSQQTDCVLPSAPICDSDGHCRPCISTAECPNSVCILTGANTGQCASANQIVWVDNNNPNCSSGDGRSPTTSFCNIDQAIGLIASRPYIHVAGSNTAYAASTAFQASSTNIGPVQVSGPGIAASPSARVFSLANDSFDVSAAAGHQATVVLEGLELGGTGATKGNFGINTSTTGSGTVSLSVIGCFIHDNNSGGITLAGATTYSIENDIIANNGSATGSSAGVVIANSATGTFAFNTVAANSVASGPSGVDCSSTSKPIVNTIVTTNLSAGGGPQISANCSQTNIVQSGVDFVSTTDWHLKADSTNSSCCIDQIKTDPGTPFKSVDVNGTIRPKGNGWDIGAHEVQ